MDNQPVDGLDLLHALPRIRRARAHRLYTEDGRRLVDLWLDGGAAVLGHTPPRVLTVLKDTASRGLFPPFPHHGLNRLVQVLLRWFPGRTILVYPNPQSANRALGGAGLPLLDEFLDTGTSDPDDTSIALKWRPWASRASPPPGAVIAPVLPFPGPGAPVILLPPTGRETCMAPSIPISPVACAVATRGLADLLSQYPQRSLVSCRRSVAALESTPWIRRGIYLHRQDDPFVSQYGLQFHRFLQGGVLIPPDPRLPFILPEVLSPGEDEALAGILKIEA